MFCLYMISQALFLACILTPQYVYYLPSFITHLNSTVPTYLPPLLPLCPHICLPNCHSAHLLANLISTIPAICLPYCHYVHQFAYHIATVPTYLPTLLPLCPHIFLPYCHCAHLFAYLIATVPTYLPTLLPLYPLFGPLFLLPGRLVSFHYRRGNMTYMTISLFTLLRLKLDSKYDT